MTTPFWIRCFETIVQQLQMFRIKIEKLVGRRTEIGRPYFRAAACFERWNPATVVVDRDDLKRIATEHV